MEIIYRPPKEDGQWEELGPYRLQALIDRDQEGALTCYLVRLAPHSRTRTSYHARAEEIYYVLSGHGTAFLNGEAYPLRPRTFLRLPPGTLHAFSTDDEPLELLDVHSPGSWPDRDLFFVDESTSSENPT